MEATELTREYEGSTIPAAGTYAFDPAHTHVGFNVRHMMVAKVRGYFAAPAGTFTVAEDPTQSSVQVELDWSTVETGDPKRDAHLRSPDFFNVEKFPTISYRSTGVRHVKGDNWVLDGELTVQDITRPVALELEVNGVGRDPYGNVKVGFSATTKINREDFGLTYNAVLETGGVMVGKDVTIEIDVEAALQA
ncbi:MAG TPA: YceI family protein [Acidimicrobiales bacterium]|jgi:polyisoprenoid-binding protein YceI